MEPAADRVDAPGRARWDGEEAWRNVLGQASSRWLADRRSRHWSATAASRLERAVVLPEIRPSFRLERSDRIFTIGSCFARHIENHLIARGYDVRSQDLDIPGFEYRPPHSSVILNKFTTHSMLNELRWALDPACAFPEESLVEEREGGWVDLQVVGEVSPAPRATVLARRPYVADVFRRIRECRVVVMTLGLVEAWYDHAFGLYLNRAPGYRTVRRHPGRFELRLLDHRANLDALEALHALLQRHGPRDLRLVLTVSPVPLSETFTGRDVLVANTYSKSTLRAAAEDFARAHAHVDYYPSYESVVLSDRRVAYQDDLHHVADAIVDVNVRRFLSLYGRDGAATAQDEEAAADAVARHAGERLARLEHDLLAENARLRAEVSQLSARLESRTVRIEAALFEQVAGLSRDGTVELRGGGRMPVGARIAGYAEVGERRGSELLVSGWAVDLDAPRRPPLLVAFVDGHPMAWTTASIARPDVAQALGVDAPDAGFSLTLGLPPERAGRAVRVAALTQQGEAKELGYHHELYRLPRG